MLALGTNPRTEWHRPASPHSPPLYTSSTSTCNHLSTSPSIGHTIIRRFPRPSDVTGSNRFYSLMDMHSSTIMGSNVLSSHHEFDFSYVVRLEWSSKFSMSIRLTTMSIECLRCDHDILDSMMAKCDLVKRPACLGYLHLFARFGLFRY